MRGKVAVTFRMLHLDLEESEYVDAGYAELCH